MAHLSSTPARSSGIRSRSAASCRPTVRRLLRPAGNYRVLYRIDEPRRTALVIRVYHRQPRGVLRSGPDFH
ncbi:MAG: hypothetical protein FJW85_00005 [Actinobacteria bacterium]|nr:hypothetical protein [Actinomycetota bacterium]